MSLHIVVLAGGRGERLWPWSAAHRPKQFLPLFEDGLSPFQAALRRAHALPGAAAVWVSTLAEYVPQVREQARAVGCEIPPERMICEPEPVNTAASFALAAAAVSEPGAVVALVPSDHWIGVESKWTDAVSVAARAAASGAYLVTVGVTPTRPDTGYGYIQCKPEQRGQLARPVVAFHEKPDPATAARFVTSRGYVWNAGILVGQVATLELAFALHAPDLWERISSLDGAWAQPGRILEALDGWPRTSFDYAVLEKADNIRVVPGSFPWDDIGSWTALDRIWSGDTDGNRTRGDVVVHQSHESMVVNDQPGCRVVLFHVDDLIVAAADNTVVVASKAAASRWRDLAAMLHATRVSEVSPRP